MTEDQVWQAIDTQIAQHQLRGQEPAAIKLSPAAKVALNILEPLTLEDGRAYPGAMLLTKAGELPVLDEDEVEHLALETGDVVVLVRPEVDAANAKLRSVVAGVFADAATNDPAVLAKLQAGEQPFATPDDQDAWVRAKLADADIPHE